VTRRRFALWSVAVVAVALIAGLALLSRPARVTVFVLSALGDALGLEIAATGANEYRVLGSPMLVLRNVSAREPGAAKPLLRAQRMLVSLPWSTVRSRGARLDITRIELDAPILDLPALQHWLAARPSGETRMPTLSDGLRVDGGRIDGDGWRIDGLALSLPRLQPRRRVDAHVKGRYRGDGADALAARFDLSVAMTAPANGAGVALRGSTDLRARDWRMPVRIDASGPLRIDDDGIRIARLRASIAARYEASGRAIPFAFALNAPLSYRNGALGLAPAGFALRGPGARDPQSPVPNATAAGTLGFGKRLLLRIGGRIATWPQAWPALPPPLATSRAPLAFVADYAGPADFSQPLALHLRRDATVFDGRFRVADVAAWATAADAASPLPPLTGRLSTPRLEISGAQLEGVEVEFDDPASPGDAPQ
jgi:hypothetical protein